MMDMMRLHLAALIDADVEQELILIVSSPLNWNDVLACFRMLYPAKRFPGDIKDEPKDLSKFDNSRGAALLKAFTRPGFTDLEESVSDNTAGL